MLVYVLLIFINKKISKSFKHYFLDWIGKLKLGISLAVEIDFDDISDILLPIEILL